MGRPTPINIRVKEREGLSMSKVHLCKTYPRYYDEVDNGNKTFELRQNDKDYQKGDEVILQKLKYDEETISNYVTGAEIRILITHVLSHFGLKEGWVGLSFRKTNPKGADNNGR